MTDITKYKTIQYLAQKEIERTKKQKKNGKIK